MSFPRKLCDMQDAMQDHAGRFTYYPTRVFELVFELVFERLRPLYFGIVELFIMEIRTKLT